LYKLVSVFNKHLEFKKQVSTILTMPSLLGFLFTNQTYNEFTHASTTQLLNTGTQDWDGKIIEKVFAGQLPLAEIKATNTVVGYTKNELNEVIGIEQISDVIVQYKATIDDV